MGRDPSGAARRARDRTPLDVGEARQGRLVWRLGEARLALVQGQVILLQVLCLLLLDVLEALVQVCVLKALLKVLMLDVLMMMKVKEFVVEVLLFSLSSTSFPRTRPAARVWA